MAAASLNRRSLPFETLRVSTGTLGNRRLRWPSRGPRSADSPPSRSRSTSSS